MVFFNKCDQICSFLQICKHLLKKSFMENFICAVGRGSSLVQDTNPLLSRHIHSQKRVFDLFRRV